MKQNGQKLFGYNGGAIILHWLIALLIIVQLATGYLMARSNLIHGSEQFKMIQWHKTFGLLVLILTIIRILWRLANKPPQKFPMSWLEAWTAGLVSFLFYALMLIVPLLGWVMVSVSTTGIPTLFFLIPDLVWPDLPLKANAALGSFAKNGHMVLAYCFILLLFLHIGGAFKHMLIDHMPELSRMLPNKRLQRQISSRKIRSIALSLFVFLILLGFGVGQLTTYLAQTTPNHPTPNHPTMAQSKVVGGWMIDYSKSSLSYRLPFSGVEKQGHIQSWQADIVFSPEQLDKAHADIRIDANSIDYADSFVSGSIKSEDGLSTDKFPEITITLDHFEQNGQAFIATGHLTIRAISLPLSVAFNFTLLNDNNAHVVGHAEIDRLAFGLGKSNDPDAQWLGKTISVQFDLTANK